MYLVCTTRGRGTNSHATALLSEYACLDIDSKHPDFQQLSSYSIHAGNGNVFFLLRADKPSIGALFRVIHVCG